LGLKSTSRQLFIVIVNPPPPEMVRGILRAWVQIPLEGMVLNDYCRGALEALAWVQVILENVDPMNGKSWAGFINELQAVKEEILSGIAVDFRSRVRSY